MRTEEGDAGFTLLDTLMSTVVMTIVMAIFTSSIVAMYRTANATDAKAIAQTQISTALERLDREVRYAEGIARVLPGETSVDFLTVRQGHRQCVQVRLLNGVLARRTWTHQATPIDLSPWTTLATDVTSAAPFTYVAPTATLGYQQLKVSLTVVTADGRDENTTSFTAMNSSRTSGNDYCSAARGL